MLPLILVYSETNASNIATRIGMPEYSYYFVLKWLLPVLGKIGDVKIILDPAIEADTEYQKARQQGRDCVLFSFAPPHRTVLPKHCPVVPLVAWEFERIPDYQWDKNPYNDWRALFHKTGIAITHSEFARQAILRAMGEDYPVWSIPSPVWDCFAERGQRTHREGGRVPGTGLDLHIKGMLLDSATFMPTEPPTAAITAQRPREDKVLRKLRRAARRRRSLQKLISRITRKPLDTYTSSPYSGAHHVRAKGVIYTSILNPRDGRKNWGDIGTAFVSCFQNNPDAVLIFKLNEHNSADSLYNLSKDLGRFTWMKCRVIAFNGYLADADYQNFLDSTDYVVNASTGEGQCLPLMELMSMGVPAIAPDHTSMADYITPQNAFILPSSKYLTCWPHDPRFLYSTKAFRVPWESLVAAYDQSYKTARHDIAAYQSMSNAARSKLESHCSQRVVLNSLNAVMTQLRKSESTEKSCTDNEVHNTKNIHA